MLYKAPIIPVAVIGAEEQAPILMSSKSLGSSFGVDTDVPITLNSILGTLLGPLAAFPFPSKYTIHYGEPICFYDEFSAETTRNPDMVKTLAEEVKAVIQDMITAGLRERKSVFGG